MPSRSNRPQTLWQTQLEHEGDAGESRLFKRLLGMVYRHGNRLYNFKGIRFTKSRFRGREVPVFVAHRARLPAADALAVFKLSRVF